MTGTIVGVFLLGIVANGLNLFGVSPFWRPVAVGLACSRRVAFDGYSSGASFPLNRLAASARVFAENWDALESLALREGKTDRSIRMTLSLAFLAPDIATAAVEGACRGATVSSVSWIFP